MRLTKSILSLVVILASAAIAQAQTPAPEGGDNTVDGGQVLVESPAKLTLEVAERNTAVPEAMDSLVEIPNVEYEVLDRKLGTEYKPEKIEAAKLTVVDKLDKLYGGYIKVGMGTNTTPLVDAYYGSTRNKNGSWGVRVKHLSSTGGIDSAATSAFSDNMVKLYGKSFAISQHTLKGELDWNRNVNHFYGVNPTDTVPERDTIRQRFQRFGGSVGLLSHYEGSADLNYGGNLGFYHLYDNYGAKETNIKLDGFAQYPFDREVIQLNGLLDINTNTEAPISAVAPLTPTPVTTDPFTNVILSFNPELISTGLHYKVRVGGVIAADIDHTARFRFYPDLEARYSLFNDILIPYASIKGGLERNSLRSLTAENPFMLTNSQLENTNVRYRFTGGIRGTLSAKMSFNASVSAQQAQDHVLFVHDTIFTPWNQFSVVYDQVDQLAITGELSYLQSEKLKLHLKGQFFNYKTETELHAWNLPKYRIAVGGVYDLGDKILVRADLFAVGERMERSLDPVAGVDPEASAGLNRDVYPVKLPGYIDANLGFEYRSSKKLSVFMNFTNLASSNYQRWYNYRTQGLNVLGGLTWSF